MRIKKQNTSCQVNNAAYKTKFKLTAYRQTSSSRRTERHVQEVVVNSKTR